MANNYDVTTGLTKIPSDCFKEYHKLALDLVGFNAEDEGAEVYLYTSAESGTTDLDLGDFSSDGFNEAWSEMLEETGLAAYADEPFVLQLRQRLEGHSRLDWAEVVQAVLRDLPAEAVPHLDFQGAYWCDKERSGEFGGFAVRVMRDKVLVHESAEAYFRRLDHEQQWTDEVRAKPPQDRVLDVATAVIGEGETSLGHALRNAFPEATQGDVALGADATAVEGLSALVRHWVEVNVSDTEDAPEAPHP